MTHPSNITKQTVSSVTTKTREWEELNENLMLRKTLEIDQIVQVVPIFIHLIAISQSKYVNKNNNKNQVLICCVFKAYCITRKDNRTFGFQSNPFFVIKLNIKQFENVNIDKFKRIEMKIFVLNYF